jgi:hypothetical protein
MIGSELQDLDSWTLKLLTNEEVLFLLKGSYGAEQLERDGFHAVWVSNEKESGAKFVALFNLSDKKAEISIELENIGLPQKVSVRDLWEKKNIGIAEKKVSAEIGPHGAVLYKLA